MNSSSILADPAFEAMRLRDQVAIALSYCYGMRASELGKVRWDHVDFDRDRIYLARSKRGVAGWAPLLPIVRGLLYAQRQQRRTAYVLPGRRTGRGIERTTAFRIVKRFTDAVGLQVAPGEANPLRHLATRDLDDAGVPTAAIQALLGHRRRTSTEAYLRRVRCVSLADLAPLDPTT